MTRLAYRLGIRLAVVLSCLAMLPQAIAQDAAVPGDACPTSPVPQIKVVADILDFVYDHSHALAELGTIGTRSPTTSGHDVKRIFGITRQGFSFGQGTAGGRVLQRADGGYCVGYRDSTITLRLTTEIFIAREIPAGSCLYGQVLAHEERHAKVGRRLFSEFGATMEKAIAEALAEAPFLPIADPAGAPQAALVRLKEMIEPHYRDFRSVYRKRQAIIDTSGEYARVREACPGEQEKLVQE